MFRKGVTEAVRESYLEELRLESSFSRLETRVKGEVDRDEEKCRL